MKIVTGNKVIQPKKNFNFTTTNFMTVNKPEQNELALFDTWDD